MKKLGSLFLVIVMLLALWGCSEESTNKDNGSIQEDSNKIQSEYVGEWKANVVSSFMNGEYTYKVAVITLNADGTATYKSKNATWEYKDNTIHLAVAGAGIAVFEIAEDGGKTVLKYYEDTYYRASEFVESN